MLKTRKTTDKWSKNGQKSAFSLDFRNRLEINELRTIYLKKTIKTTSISLSELCFDLAKA